MESHLHCACVHDVGVVYAFLVKAPMINLHSELWLQIGELKTLSMHKYISCMISSPPVINIYMSVISSFNSIQFSFKFFLTK